MKLVKKRNIFLGAYAQPERMAYNFLCLLEHMSSQRAFYMFLTDNRINLAADPVLGIKAMVTVRSVVPAGAITLVDTDGQEWIVYIDIKSGDYPYRLYECRRGLNPRRVQGQLKEFCDNPHSLLLIISPRSIDKQPAESISGKVVFKSWNEITAHLDRCIAAHESDDITRQFNDYLRISGESFEMDFTQAELDVYVATIRMNVNLKLTFLLENAIRSLDLVALGIRQYTLAVDERSGRSGGFLSFHPKNPYRSTMFFGFYHQTEVLGLPFQSQDTPELAFFWEIDPSKREALKSVSGMTNCFERLKSVDFEENLFTEISPKQGWFLAKRISLSDLPGLTLESVRHFIEAILIEVTQEEVLRPLIGPFSPQQDISES
jgi:hypothetical protein